ncbi:MAG: hypothetical protein OXT09_22750 [Myxococcales bacterium]|nr:hypothetical protein [Myxococcales bacterium]
METRRTLTRALLAALLSALAMGCTFDVMDDDDDGVVGFSPPSAASVSRQALRDCGFESEEVELLMDMSVELDNSVHELIKCGQLQAGVARNLVMILVLSNEGLFNNARDFETIAEIAGWFGLMAEAPLSGDGEGHWTIPIGSTPGSQFEVMFYEPGSSEPILADPFVMESYLEGVEVTSTLTLDEMIEDWEARNTFTFTYQETGPLAHLLNGGEVIPNPFEVRVSARDLILLGSDSSDEDELDGGPTFGPLESLADAQMTSSVRLRDPRSALSMSYDDGGARDTLANVASAGVAFDLDGLSVEHGDGGRLVSGGVAIDFVPGVGLAGDLRLTVGGLSADAVLESDYGAGTDNPRTRWACRE